MSINFNLSNKLKQNEMETKDVLKFKWNKGEKLIGCKLAEGEFATLIQE